MGSGWQAALELGRRQRGTASRPQLLALGISSEQIDSWRRLGLLLRLFHGVYLVGASSAAPGAAETGALLAGGPRAALCRRSAAAWWQIEAGDPLFVHILVPPPHRGHRAGIRVHRVRVLRPEAVTEHRGLRLTTPLQTLFDLSAARYSRLERAVSEAHRHGLITPDALRAACAERRGQPGAPSLRELAGFEARGYTSSQNERRMRSLCRQAGLPQPWTDRPVAGWEVDFLWEEAKLIVEIDDYNTHSSRRQFEVDRRKQSDLVAAGYVVLRFTATQLHSEPMMVIGSLAKALFARE